MNALFKTRFAGLTLPSPIIVASSGLTDSLEKNKELDKAGAGALVLKSLFEEQIELQSAKLNRLSDKTNYPDTDDYLYDYVKSSQVSSYLQLIKATKEECHIPVIASINCDKQDSWIDFAHQIERAGADALELNIFAINTDITPRFSLEETYIEITRKVKEVVNIPVIIKMSKYFSNIVNLVDRLIGAGANGIVMFNRFYQPDININNLQISSGSLFSSQADISDTLRWTAIVSGKIPEASISSNTGIHEWDDVVKCILCGASSVEICSTIYQHGNQVIPAILQSMEEWMHSMNFNCLDAFRGKLNYREIPDPSSYERSQFMKYFSNRD